MRMRTRLMTTWTCAMSVGLFAASGCGAETEAPYDGPAIAITAAPLTLPGVTDGCYGLTIKSASETVWSKTGICGHGYGAGASVSYVGPCDASGTGLHTVELVLEGLCSFGDCTGGELDQVWDNDMGSYSNPCPEGNPCVQADVACSENADTPVTFEIAVMREANQGFFDIAVNFNNIFCSAKFDCAYPGPTADPADDIPIQLLHDSTGGRGLTAVLGFACTAGVGDTETVLALSDIDVECDVSYVQFSPDTDGNVDLANALYVTDPSPLYAASVSRGTELLKVGSQNANKVYWNVMLGYSDINEACVVYAEGTALDGADTNAQLASPATPSGVTYPVLVWNIELTDANGDRLCSQHPLDLDTSFDHANFDIHSNIVTAFYANVPTGYVPDQYPLDENGFYRFPEYVAP